MVVKSATKKKLMNLGIADNYSHVLAYGNEWNDVINLTSQEIAQICETDSETGDTIHGIIIGAAKKEYGMGVCNSPTCDSEIIKNHNHCNPCRGKIGALLLTTCDLIYELALEVNSELYYEYPGGSVEKRYQDAFSSELRAKGFHYQAETSMAQHYKDFPLSEVRADYFILPGGVNTFDKNIVLEVKHANSANQQLQLFHYLHLGPTNNNLLTKNLKYGILLIWPTQSKPVFNENGNKAELSGIVSPIMELWVTSNPRKRTKFELLSRWADY
jgi:GxxExxY protein